jgi:hypothetical protein
MHIVIFGRIYLFSLDSNPIRCVERLWVGLNLHKGAILKKVARRVISLPIDSTSAEKVFSAAGLLSRHHHMNLKPQTGKLMFLKTNSKAL